MGDAGKARPYWTFGPGARTQTLAHDARSALTLRRLSLRRAPCMVTTEQYVGNYMTKSNGFIRVRRRNFYPSRFGAASYDVVHAVRINGKPRHTFVLGLGSLRDKRPERGK